MNLRAGVVPLAYLGLSAMPMSGLASSSKGVVFEEVAAPRKHVEKTKVQASQWVEIDGKKHPIGWHVIAKTGTELPKLGGKGTEVFGQVKDQAGDPIIYKDGSKFVCRTSRDGSGPDHTTLHEVQGELFAITQFECAPGAMYISKLKKTQGGGLKAESTRHISQSDYHGGWVHCAGMKTPWGTHLASEEYEPNAADVNEANVNSRKGSFYNGFGRYFKEGQKAVNPYYYGWTPEVAIKNKNGDTDYVKHYSMGRLAHELAFVMPDQKTVYLTDDGTNGVLFMFVADKPADLSKGTLYAAKLKQVSASNGGYYKLNWINLGYATNAEIRKAVDSRKSFGDIFASAEPKAGKCPKGFTSINTQVGRECLQVKKGMEVLASRLESRRYAAMLGATSEFRKKEGLTYDPSRNHLYMALSRIQYGMEDNRKKGEKNLKYDIGGANDIRLEKNGCGGVYRLAMQKRPTDQLGKKVASDYVASDMTAELLGKPMTYAKDSPFNGNKCSVDHIAEPDNLTFITGSDVLIIGEDTNERDIDYVWAYNVKTKRLTRILTATYGAETTSPFWYADIGGQGYLTTVIQHPYGESDQDKATGPQDKESFVGVIGPFPKFSAK